MAEQTSTEANAEDGMRAKNGSNESVDGKTRVRNRRPDKQLYVPRARRLMEKKASPSAIQDSADHSALSTQLISSRVEKITGEVEIKDEHSESLNNLATSESRPLNVTKSHDSVSDKNVTEDMKLCLTSVNQTDNISGTDKEDSTESKLFHPSFVKQNKEKKIRMENAMSSSVYPNMHSAESGNCVLTDSLSSSDNKTSRVKAKPQSCTNNIETCSLISDVDCSVTGTVTVESSHQNGVTVTGGYTSICQTAGDGYFSIESFCTSTSVVSQPCSVSGRLPSPCDLEGQLSMPLINTAAITNQSNEKSTRTESPLTSSISGETTLFEVKEICCEEDYICSRADECGRSKRKTEWKLENLQLSKSRTFLEGFEEDEKDSSSLWKCEENLEEDVSRSANRVIQKPFELPSDQQIENVSEFMPCYNVQNSQLRKTLDGNFPKNLLNSEKPDVVPCNNLCINEGGCTNELDVDVEDGSVHPQQGVDRSHAVEDGDAKGLKNKTSSLKELPCVISQRDDKRSSGEVDEDSWEAIFDENGEYCKHEIAKRLGVSKENVKIQQPKHDYTVFCPQDPDITDEKFGHIIEIYGFPVELKTHDLVNAFSAYKLKDFDIKWVDDTHALGVFASPLVASDVLTIHNPLLKVRPLSQATRESKHKAYRLSEFLQPPKPRPATSAALARRLVSGALGLKVQVSREQQKLEKAKLQEAKEKKRKAAKQRVDIWEGKVD